MKRIVLFAEGEGEATALPKLIKRLLTELNAWGSASLDPDPFRVGSLGKLVKDDCREWKRKLGAALKRRDLGGVLLVLDGDTKKIGNTVFCAATVAKSLATESVKVGGGRVFSVAVVFARQEYESWLIAGIDSLAGKRLPDNRLVSAEAKAPDGDLEENPRDAKGWFDGVIEGGYRPTRDQAALTDLVDLNVIRSRSLRSFRRLESAVSGLVAAIQSSLHVVTPPTPSQ